MLTPLSSGRADATPSSLPSQRRADVAAFRSSIMVFFYIPKLRERRQSGRVAQRDFGDFYEVTPLNGLVIDETGIAGAFAKIKDELRSKLGDEVPKSPPATSLKFPKLPGEDPIKRQKASRVLKMERFCLEHLLNHFCGVKANKQYQNADWRIRPLPHEMINFPKDFTPKKKLIMSGESGLSLSMVLFIGVVMKIKANWMVEFVGSWVENAQGRRLNWRFLVDDLKHS